MSICDRCIHDYVCGLEDNHEEGIVSCADMFPKDVLDKIRAEVEELDGKYVIGDYATYGEHSPKYVQVMEVLQVIDKYRNEVSK